MTDTPTVITWSALSAAGANIHKVQQDHSQPCVYVAYDVDNPADATTRVVFGAVMDEDGNYPVDGHYSTGLPIVWAWTEYERDGDEWVETGIYDLDATFEGTLAKVAEVTGQ